LELEVLVDLLAHLPHLLAVQILFLAALHQRAVVTVLQGKALLMRQQAALVVAVGAIAHPVRLALLVKVMQAVVVILIQRAQGVVAHQVLAQILVREKVVAQDHHLQFLAHL
jgi:hypothetical protein